MSFEFDGYRVRVLRNPSDTPAEARQRAASLKRQDHRAGLGEYRRVYLDDAGRLREIAIEVSRERGQRGRITSAMPVTKRTRAFIGWHWQDLVRRAPDVRDGGTFRLDKLERRPEPHPKEETLDVAAEKIKGVSRHSQTGRWYAQIARNGKMVSLGLYATKLDAARARWHAEDIKANVYR